jgi:putative photosynthetic complex assembly protein 2
MNAFASYGLTVLATLFVWWFSTGLIVFLDGLPKRTFRWSFGITSALCALACAGLVLTSSDTTTSGAAWAFFCAIIVWGWNEMAFLMGYITGPRPEPCPAGVRGWPRFVFAVKAILYHEVAILASLGLVAVMLNGQPNQFGLYTFALLWLMRLSAKLNLFFGVPNRTEEFLPEGLAYLKSYFKSASMNPLLPISITAATIAAVLLAQLAASAATGGFEATGWTLLCTLLVLAIVEHWMMIVPIPAALLWGWGLKSHEAKAQNSAEATVLAAATLLKQRQQAPLLGKQPSGLHVS